MAATSRGLSSWLRLPRPKTFLGLMSLQTGAELISLALVFNKATGIYGFLTLFTGFLPSALQVTWFALSSCMIVALAFLIPHIWKQSPFHSLALAWLYVLDTIANIAYTAAFGTIWYVAVSSSEPHDPTGRSGDGPAAVLESSREDVKEVPSNPDTAASMVLFISFTLVRVYFSLVVMAFARMVVQRYGDDRGDTADEIIASGSSPNPFAEGTSLGEGWKGKLGRIMISVGRGYWLGMQKEDEEWARHMSAKFSRRTTL